MQCKLSRLNVLLVKFSFNFPIGKIEKLQFSSKWVIKLIKNNKMKKAFN